jgi:PGF-pre-PGF domain-containing protein
LTVDIDTDRNFELSVTAYNDDLTPSASILRGDTASAQAETRGVSNDVRTAAQSFESQMGTISAGYLKINTTLAPEQVTNGSIEFSIRRSYLHELGVEPEDITLYHRLSDGKWEERATAYRNSGERYHHFKGTTSKFSMFVIDTDAPQLDVTNSRLAKTKIETGETVTATATVTNRGLTAGETTVNLTVGGAVVDTETVVVESGDSKDVTLSFDGGEPGKYDLTVGGSDLETLSIEDAEEATPSPTPMNGDTPSAGAIDGSSPLLAVTILLLVLLALGLWWRRTE